MEEASCDMSYHPKGTQKDSKANGPKHITQKSQLPLVVFALFLNEERSWSPPYLLKRLLSLNKKGKDDNTCKLRSPNDPSVFFFISNITMQMSKDMREYNVESMQPISSPLSIVSLEPQQRTM